jgi:hypothetical protein
VREVTYEEVTFSTNRKNPNLKGKAMDKKKIVDALIENERTSWTEEHRKTLMDLEESLLTIMQDDAAAEPVAEEPKAEPKAEEPKAEAKSEPAPAANAQPSKPLSVQEYIQNAPPEVREALETSMKSLNEQKANLVENIMANDRNTFTKEHLEAMGLEMLQHMAQLAAPPADEAQPHTTPLYIGQQDGNIPKAGNSPEPLLLPTMNCGEEKKTG